LSGCGDLRIVKELHRQFFLLLLFLLLLLRDGYGLLDPFGDFLSATNNVRPTQRRAVDTVWKLKMKIFSRISL
jgi:hypothetical protein